MPASPPVNVPGGALRRGRSDGTAMAGIPHPRRRRRSTEDPVRSRTRMHRPAYSRARDRVRTMAGALLPRRKDSVTGTGRTEGLSPRPLPPPVRTARFAIMTAALSRRRNRHTGETIAGVTTTGETIAGTAGNTAGMTELSTTNGTTTAGTMKMAITIPAEDIITGSNADTRDPVLGIA